MKGLLKTTSYKKEKTFFGIIYDKFLSIIGGQQYLSIQLDITNACNLRCKHCYHPDHTNNELLKLSDWEKIIDQYEALCLKLHLKPFVAICGGEPTTSNLLLPIIKYLNSKWLDIEVAILTNGTLINDQLIKALSHYKVSFQVSLDGPNIDLHDMVRGKGSFISAIAGIKKLNDNGFTVDVQTVLSKRNKPFISKFFELAKELPIRSLNFTRLIIEGHSKQLVEKGEDSVLSPLSLKEAYTQIIDQSRSSGIKTNTNQPLYHLIDSHLGSNGKYGFQGLVVDYKGNLKISSRANYVIGSIIEKGLQGLFLDNPILKNLRNGKIAKCGQCKYYKKCGGDRNASYAATNSFLECDPGCWLINK